MTYLLTSQEYDQCLADLRVTDPRDDKMRIEATKGGLLQGAYRWILAHDDFRRWRNDPDCHLLWFKGDPGKGKTMLLCGIINELGVLEDSKNPIAYFFCQATDIRLNSATAVLRGLIYMLIDQQPSLISHVRKKYKHAGKQLFEDANAWEALSEIFASILQEPGLQDIYLIIDALDECQHNLPRLLKLINHHSAAGRIKWIVSSRNKVEIERGLRISESNARLSLELQANADQVAYAVNAYVDHRVSEIAAAGDWDMSLQEYARQTLQTKANGTFLWAALVVQELQEANSWEVKYVLDEVPSGLNELYDRMIQQIEQLKRDNIKHCRKLLSVITAAYRPLYLAELRLISGLLPGISLKLDDIAKITKMCGSFLTIRDHTVYFVHQSAKDYLVNNVSDQLFPLGITHIHNGIYSKSIEGMSNVLRRDMCGLGHPGASIKTDKLASLNFDPLSAVRYSCVYWVNHVSDGDPGKDIQDEGIIQRFLEQNFLYWLEALALLETVSEGISSISKLLNHVQVRYTV